MNQVDQIKNLQRQGYGAKAISGMLGLNRKTLSRYMQRVDHEQKLVGSVAASSRIDPFKTTIDE